MSSLRERISDRYNITKSQLNDLVDKTKEISQRAKIWENTDPPEKQRQIDEFLFTPDELPYLGKEYWFLLLTGTGNNHTDQLMISFGRNKNNTMTIDGQNQMTDTDEYMGGIGEIWYHNRGKTKKLGKLGGKIISTDLGVEFSTMEYHVKFSGKFPNYRVEVGVDNQTVVSVATTAPKIGDSMEFFSIDRFNMGVVVGNVYLDFEGQIAEQDFKGRAYMQKVVMSAPFIPWYWGRFVFQNGSVLVFFLLWVDFPGMDRVIYTQGKFYDVEQQKYHVFKNFNIDHYENTPYFILHHQSEKYNIFVMMDCYTNNIFRMESRGEFVYNEMFAEIREIRIEIGDDLYDNNYFGKGSGSLEEATGMCF